MLHESFHDRTVRRLDGDEDRCRRRASDGQQPGDHVGQAFAAMRESAFTDLAPLASATCT